MEPVNTVFVDKNIRLFVFEANVTDGYHKGSWVAARYKGVPKALNFDTGDTLLAKDFKTLYKTLDRFCRVSVQEIYAESRAG